MCRSVVFVCTVLMCCVLSQAADASASLITMYNGRPGARLVMHLYPGSDGYVRTSTLGQPYPSAASKRNLFLINKPDGKPASIVPLASDSRIVIDPVEAQNWGLSCNGLTTQSGITLRMRSPYKRFNEFGDHFAAKASTAPLFVIDIEIHNPQNETVSGQFLVGMDHAQAICTRAGVCGVLLDDLMDGNKPAGGQLCLAGSSSNDLRAVISHDMVADFAGIAPKTSSDIQGGLIWRYKIPARSKVTRHFVFAGYLGKVMMHGALEPETFVLNYTRWWKNAEDVAAWGVNSLPKLVAMDEELENCSGIRRLDDNHRFVISQSVAEHLSDTHLLCGSSGRIVWMYSEAGFSAGYLSTVDLIPDTFLLNKTYFPWTLKMLVDLHSRYIVQDGLGSYVTHDVGASNFEPRGNYGESGPGARMPVEETCNYVHLLWLTWCETHDRSILQARAAQMVQLVNSLCVRDQNGDGVPDVQANAAESNTFDNGGLVGITRNSTYLGLKVWTSCRFLAVMLSEVSRFPSAARAADLADRAEKTLIANVRANGYFWTLLDQNHPNYSASCLWITKGLLTAYISGFNMGPYREIEQACAQHTESIAPKLRKDYGYLFDSVPTSRVTWQSQSMLIDLMARNYWNGMDLGVADMMARSGRASGVLNEFVGPNSGLASDTEWPAEQVYSRMASAVGWLPGVMPKPVYRKSTLIRWCAGNNSITTANGQVWAPSIKNLISPKLSPINSPVTAGIKGRELFAVLISGGSKGLRWKTGVLPAGTYYIKLLGNETGLFSKSVKATANGIRLKPSRDLVGNPLANMPAVASGMVRITKASPIEIILTGSPASSGASALEISSEPTSTRDQLERPCQISVSLSSARLRADGTDSMKVTAELLDTDGVLIKANGTQVRTAVESGDGQIVGNAIQASVDGKAEFVVKGGRTVGDIVLAISSPSLPRVARHISVGGAVTYLVDVGRDGGAVMDSRNRLWVGDCRYNPELGYGELESGNVVRTSGAISNTPDPTLYQTYRWSNDKLAYRFDTYEPGDYLVRLLFAETFFGTDSAKGTGEGSRVINALINGKSALFGFDVFKSAGGANKAVDRSFIVHIDHTDPIMLELTASANCPSLAGIEVRRYESSDKQATRLE